MCNPPVTPVESPTDSVGYDVDRGKPKPVLGSGSGVIDKIRGDKPMSISTVVDLKW